jgi:hypothetical protein
MKTEDIEFVLGKCDLCEVIKTYAFSGNRCLETCEVCDITRTIIHRVNLEVGA